MKIKEQIYRTLAVVSFIGLYATFGGLECEMITIGKGIFQAIAFLGLMIIFNRQAENARRKAERVRKNG